MKPIDQLSIRRRNIYSIWNLFSERAVMTRQEMAEATGLSLMTVTNLVDQLDSFGVLEFAAPVDNNQQKKAGRKADLISLSSKRHAWIVIDLTTLRFRFSALTLNLKPIFPVQIHTYKQELDYETNLRHFLYAAKKAIAEQINGREIIGAAVVVPGPYHVDTDRVSNKRVPQLNEIGIKAALRDILGSYEYYVDEDVKFAVRAFLPIAQQTNSEVLYYLYIGEGVGGASIHHENVLRGFNTVAGDAGQLLSASGKTYESLLSLRAFAEDCMLSTDDNDSDSELMKRIHGCYEQDCERYLQALKKAAVTTGNMLHNVCWLLDPKHVVIDCCYAWPCKDVFCKLVEQQLTCLLGDSAQAPGILPSPFEMQSVIPGAIKVISREWIARVV